MKKILFVLPLLLIACSKKEANIQTTENTDTTVTAPDYPVVLDGADSVKDGFISESDIAQPAAEPNKSFRVVEDGKIVRTINGDMLPLTLSDELSAEGDEYVIKIKNYSNKNISGTIYPEEKEMNIRFNQIKKADGSYDGPFGRTFSAETSEAGEILLIIGRSNMASGVSTGKFKVDLK